MFLFTNENIDKIKGIVYTTEPISDKKQGKIEYSKNEGLLKDFNYSKYKIKNPPKNTSMQTYSELNFLNDLPEDTEFVKKYDDIEGVFEEICNNYNVNYPKELVNELLKSSAGIILDLKYRYNRPRPKQLAKEYGMKIGGLKLESMFSPSYPSGHSTQSKIVGEILVEVTKDVEYRNIAEKISISRNVGRVHFPSDSKLGEKLGEDLFEFLKNKR